MKTKDMIICAIFAALMCIFSVMTIPIGAVPISMGILGVLLTSCILGWKRATVSVIIYILLGTVGLPIFSGFKGGIGVITGPTGGYISSYILVALFVGFFTQRLSKSKILSIILLSAISFAGVIICYFFGTLQYTAIAHVTFMKALPVCVFPFIPFDILKCIAAAILSYAVRSALIHSKLLTA